MKRLTHYLQQPYPTTQNPIGIVIISSLLVLFILGIFQPFGIHRIVDGKALVLLGFGLVSMAGSSLVACGFPLIFKRFYGGNWTIGKNLLNTLFVLLAISVGNTCFSLFIFEDGFPFTWVHVLRQFAYFLVITVLVGIIPIAAVMFIQYNYGLKQHLQEAQEMNRKLMMKNREEPLVYDHESIVLAGNTKETVEVHPEQLLSLEAYGNYVKVSYEEKEKVKQKALRATIKQMEEQLTEYPYLVRCHRAFIVNINRIDTVRGNSQGYRLLIRHLSDEVPVSRAYAKSLRDHM